jgi:type I restriction enzyme S subunit
MFKPGTYIANDLINQKILSIGDGYRAKNSELSTEGIPFARAGNVNNGFIFDKADYFPLIDLNKVGEKISQIFDSVFTSKGSVGRIAYVKENTPQFVYSPQLCYWRSLRHDILDPRFLNYWMNSEEFVHHVNYLKGQTDMADYVSLGDQRKMQITIPSIHSQRNVSFILGSLDDKIAINQQINQTLEAMAQALFHSWFVEFDPVKTKIAAKAKGQDPEWAAMGIISGKDAVELEVLQNNQPEAFRELQATAALFPDAFVESELGEIPEGWKVGSVGNETDLSGGGTPSTSKLEYWENGDIHWSSPKDLSGKKDKILLDTERKITQLGLESITSELLPVNTVLLSSRAPIGYLALTKIPVAINQGYIALKCIKNLSPEFVLQWIHVNLNEIKQLGSGTTFPELSKKSFRQFPILVPQSSIVKAYTKIVAPYYSQMAELIKQSQTNSNLRDLLLPSLLSGEFPLCEMDFQG